MIKITGNTLNVSGPKSQMLSRSCNNCTFLWEQRSNNNVVQRHTKDIFCYKPDRQLLLPLNLPPIPSSSPLTLHSEVEEKSIYRLLYLPAQMLRLINAVL